MSTDLLPLTQGDPLMNKRTGTGIVIYYNDPNSFGIILSRNLDFYFFHIRHFTEKGDRTATHGDGLQFIPSQEAIEPFHRTSVACDVDIMQIDAVERQQIEGRIHSVKQCTSESDFLSLIQPNSAYDIVIFDAVTFPALSITGAQLPHGAPTLVFLTCVFPDVFMLYQTHIHGDVYFLGCTFDNRFSLKNTVIEGEAHFEGSRFSGAGGASFRGVSAQSLFLDFGVSGPNDMLWLNELCVPGSVILGGHFHSPIQILGDQDGGPKIATIGNIIIGKEYDKHQNINRTQIEGQIELAQVNIQGVLLIESSSVHQVNLENATIHQFSAHQSLIDGSMNLKQVRFTHPARSIDIEDTIISARLRIKYCHIAGTLCLDESSVDKLTQISHCTFEHEGYLSLYDFITGAFKLEPVDALYKDQVHRLSNQRFHLLKRESLVTQQAFTVDHIERKKLAQEYTFLKKMFADQGLLLQEDMAFYNMRLHTEKGLSAWIFSEIFGWGVRLWNVLNTCVLIIFVYAMIYATISDYDLTKSMILSFQAFFNVIFGEWDKLPPIAGLPIVFVSEAILGVLFITVLIGAYMRKLLR